MIKPWWVLWFLDFKNRLSVLRYYGIITVLLGLAMGSGKVPLLRETLENSIKKFVPAKALEVNRQAFELGFQQGAKTEEI